MRKPVVIANESEDTTQVIQRMQANGVRRLPVVAHEGEVVGIITLNDLLRLFVADANSLLGVMTKGQINEQHSRR
jgi:predicted transcriptional regulator